MSNDPWGDLRKALSILERHKIPGYPLHCEHDTLYVMSAPEAFTTEELDELDALGFFPDEEFNAGFKSYRFGSA